MAAKEAELADLLEELSNVKILIAVATKGSGRVNEHFGHAQEFQIYELSTEGSKFVGHRRVDLYCQGGYGEEDTLTTVIRAIADCVAVFVAKIGGCPKDSLKAYLRKVKSGEIIHVVCGDAEIRQGAYIAA